MLSFVLKWLVDFGAVLDRELLFQAYDIRKLSLCYPNDDVAQR